MCPITSKKKNYPFEVALSDNSKVEGVCLVDQIKNLDWRQRDIKKIYIVSEDILERVREKLKGLVGL